MRIGRIGRRALRLLERVDFRGEEHDDVVQRIKAVEHRRQELVKCNRGIGVGLGDVWQWHNLRQAVADLAFREAENARVLAVALHSESEPNRSGGEGQGDSLWGEPCGETGQDGQVGVELDAPDPADSEGE